MAKLICGMLTSLDGYVEDETGAIQWAAPDDEVASFVNDLERSVGTYLYGRRMYETMVYWETAEQLEDQSECERDFTEIWKAADKVVYSTTLDAPSSAKTRIERSFDPKAVTAMKAASDRDITVSGPNLAGQALKAGLVDEYHLFLTPVIVGGGKPALPSGVRLQFELLEERHFDSGVVFLRYRPVHPERAA
jgi:dihydrofolate reductase